MTKTNDKIDCELTSVTATLVVDVGKLCPLEMSADQYSDIHQLQQVRVVMVSDHRERQLRVGGEGQAGSALLHVQVTVTT